MTRVSKHLLGIVLALVFSPAVADWSLESNGRSGIFTENMNRHQLSIVENRDSVDFFLSLKNGEINANPDHAVIRLRGLREKSGKLDLVDTRPGRRTYLIELDKAQKTRLINQMISELVIAIEIVSPSTERLGIEFSLAGFTASLNGFLILREIGSLDYQWLFDNGKNQELLCLHAADIYVRTVLARYANISLSQLLASIPRTRIEMLDAVTGEMVDNVFGIPANRLPRDPRAEKYGIFKSCMERSS